MKRQVLRAVDLFCGAGGASTGLVRACDALGIELDLLAINHWPTAVQTHLLNHPGVRHMCEAVERIDPRKEIPGGRLNLLLAGPECTHFSTARGGRPVNPQSRASAWHIAKWAQELYIDTILIENVPEFRTWGPVGADNKPLKSKKGETFKAFLAVLVSLGYKVDVKILNAADYGDPTTRQRLFILARRGRHQIDWPDATHSKTGAATLFGGRTKWKAAREIIDWSIQGKSIFHRKKPLRPATIARILAGLEKFGGPDLQPFLVVLRNNQAGRSLDAPIPTLMANGQHIGVAQPFIIPVNHGADELRSRSVEQPLPTLTARANQYLVEPMVLGQQSNAAARPVDQPVPTIATAGKVGLIEAIVLGQQSGSVARPVDQPVPTVATDGAIALVEPFIFANRTNNAPKSIDSPVPPLCTADHIALVEPCIVQTNERRDERVSSVDHPLKTITAIGGRCIGLAEPFIVGAGGPERAGEPRSVEDPMGTVLGRQTKALVEPVITSYYGTKNVSPVSAPLPTVTTKNRFALVQPVINGLALDIRFRMLQPHELAAAMSFPKSYKFHGKREEVVRQIGNSWPGELSFALNLAIARDYTPARARRRRVA